MKATDPYTKAGGGGGGTLPHLPTITIARKTTRNKRGRGNNPYPRGMEATEAGQVRVGKFERRNVGWDS